MQMKAYIGLDIGGTKILGALFNSKGEILKREKKKTKADEGEKRVAGQIFKVIDELLAYDKNIDLISIGAGAPGIVKKESIISFSPNLPFKNFDLGTLIMDKYDVPFVLANDVNVAMLGEWKNGKHKDLKNIVGMFVGTGVGGGIIIGGELYLGDGASGEVGHIVINRDGAPCGCGSRGCLEAYASKTGIQNAIKKGIKAGEPTVLQDIIYNGVLKSSQIKEAYKQGDTLTVRAIEDAIDALGVGMANLVNTLHPQLFIFGGGLIEAMGKDILKGAKKRAEKAAMPGLMDKLIIQEASLGDDAGIVGAFELAKMYKLK